MHDSQRARLEGGQAAEGALRPGRPDVCVVHWAVRILLDAVAGSVSEALGDDWLDLTMMRNQVRAQQRARRLLKHQPGIPAMWQMRRLQKAEAALAGFNHLTVQQLARRAKSHVINAHPLPDDATGSGALRRKLKPAIDASALVGLIVTEGQPAQPADVDQAPDRLVHFGEDQVEPEVE